MGFFSSFAVGSFGVGFCAAAALLWDRRRELADRFGATDPRRRSLPKLLALVSLLVGILLMVVGTAAMVSLGAELFGAFPDSGPGPLLA